MTSTADTNLSHNMGLNCMTCHQAYGPGRGRFTVAGTVAGPDGRWVRNPRLELWASSDAGDELVIELQGDALGNFYTTAPLPLPEEQLFVRVLSEDRLLEGRMPFPTSSAGL